MGALVSLHNAVFGFVERVLGGSLLGLLARVVFALVLLVFFWNSAATKLGSGPFGLFPADGAYIQILPQRVEAVGYDFGQLGFLDSVVVWAGTYAEFALPALLVLGLFTRLAAIGMIVFVVVMTVVDITGHGVDAATIGSWFDNQAGSAIADDRTLWIFVLLVIVAKGPGPISLDWLLGRRYRRPRD